MKAQELRIGNYVHSIYGDLLRVCKISDTEMGLSNYVEAEFFDGTFSNQNNGLKPIPLTEEWLLKMGSKVERNLYCFKSGSKIEFLRFEKVYSGWMWIRSNSHLKLIDYVHQWQNLFFFLTGEELEINEESSS